MILSTRCQIVNNLEKAKVIRPYDPLFGSSRVSALLHILSRKKSMRRNSGLYKLGHGEKSVIWYWEFDMEKRYFHQFRTIDYAAAVRFYEANKFTMWEEKEKESDTEDNQEDGERVGVGVVCGDYHDHTAEHEHEEPREAETGVQGQGNSQNVQDDSVDSKDNDNQLDNEERQRRNKDIVHSS